MGVFECIRCGEEFETNVQSVVKGNASGIKTMCTSCAAIVRNEKHGSAVAIHYKEGQEINGIVFIRDLGSEIYGGKLRRIGKFACPICGDSFDTQISLVKRGTVWQCGKHRSKIFNRGEDHCAWKGGLWKTHHKIRSMPENRGWRIAVLERDNYICQKCGNKENGLHAHHIKTFAEIIQEYGIDNLTDAMECEELWDVDNGQTLCESCHKIEHKKLRRIA
jgi:5-methylcytosine-specific restriction endonuclease McrA